MATATEKTHGTTAKRNLRPYAVIAGLVVSFRVFTLLGSLLLSALGLPADLLRMVGVVVLIRIGLGLLFLGSKSCRCCCSRWPDGG